MYRMFSLLSFTGVKAYAVFSFLFQSMAFVQFADIVASPAEQLTSLIFIIGMLFGFLLLQTFVIGMLWFKLVKQTQNRITDLQDRKNAEANLREEIHALYNKFNIPIQRK